MNKEPTIGKFLDDEEREIFEAIEAEAYVPVSLMTPESKVKYQEMARNKLNEASTKISIRISETDLKRIKARAFREGLPYQTLIKSVIHKAVS